MDYFCQRVEVVSDTLYNRDQLYLLTSRFYNCGIEPQILPYPLRRKCDVVYSITISVLNV